MYIAKMTHFLNEKGNIPKDIPKEARELGNFLALIVDSTTRYGIYELYPTDIRCFEKDCEGIIQSEITGNNSEIHWLCPECRAEGYISEWENTKWNYLKNR